MIPTGQDCEEQPPGHIRRAEDSVWVATGDQWLALSLINVDGKFIDPGELTLTDGISFAA